MDEHLTTIEWSCLALSSCNSVCMFWLFACLEEEKLDGKMWSHYLGCITSEAKFWEKRGSVRWTEYFPLSLFFVLFGCYSGIPGIPILMPCSSSCISTNRWHFPTESPSNISNYATLSPLDTLQELAESSLAIETRSKSGMGLDRGLSPIYDLLVDKYFTTPDGLQGSITRLKQNKIARYILYISNTWELISLLHQKMHLFYTYT